MTFLDLMEKEIRLAGRALTIGEAFKAAEEDFVWIDEILGRTNACQS